MRTTGIVLILLAVVSYGDSSFLKKTSERIETGYEPPLPEGEVLFGQAYDGVMDGGSNCGGAYVVADDFVLTEAGRVESIEWWGVFFAGQSGSFHLRICSNDSNYQDVPGTPGDVLWEVPAASVVNTDTGDDFSGYNIYHSEIALDPSDYFEAEASVIYWFTVHYNGSLYFWGVLTSGGNMCYSHHGGDWSQQTCVCFFRLNGTSYQALEATTWAAIKSGY